MGNCLLAYLRLEKLLEKRNIHIWSHHNSTCLVGWGDKEQREGKEGSIWRMKERECVPTSIYRTLGKDNFVLASRDFRGRGDKISRGKDENKYSLKYPSLDLLTIDSWPITHIRSTGSSLLPKGFLLERVWLIVGPLPVDQSLQTWTLRWPEIN